MAPSSICFTHEDQVDLDRSELSWPWDGEDKTSLYRIEYQSASKSRSPSSNERGDEGGEDRREMVELKLQLARQQEELDALRATCGRYRVENEALRTEREALTDELALLRTEKVGHPIPRRAPWFFKQDRHQEASGGSMQLLVDANSRLMTDNAKLQVSVDGLRKSLRNYIKFSQKSCLADKEAIEKLKRENRLLRKQNSLGDGTARTSLEADDVTYPNDSGLDSLGALSTPELRSSQVKSAVDLVDFLSHNASRNNNDNSREINSNSPKIKPDRRRSESDKGLLVDFDEGRRRRSYGGAARRWHSSAY